MLNLGDMLGKVQRMQSDMAELKQRLDALELSGESGGVKVTTTGSKRILRVSLPTSLANDVEALEDHVCVATNRALDAADAEARRLTTELTQGILPPRFDPRSLGL